MPTVGQRLERLFHTDVIPTSVGRKIRLWHVAPLILVVMIATRVSGIRLSFGPSMGNTLRGVYRFERGKSPEVGQIVVFKQPNRSFKTIVWPSAKRVVRMSEEGVELRGDNHDEAEDSEDFGLVPAKNILGTIVWASAKNGFDRWLRLNEPHWCGAKKVETNEVIIFEVGVYLDVVSKTKERRIARLQGQFVDWNDDVLIYRTGKSLWSFDPQTGRKTTRKDSLYPAKSGEQVELTVHSGVSFFGPTYILVGKSLTKEAKLRIEGAIYSLRLYRELDYDSTLKRAVCSFNLTPRDDSVPSGTITAEVVSDEP